MKKRISLLCALTFVLALFCGTEVGCKKESHELKLSFYNGGYGSAWAFALAEKYEAETGVKITVDPSATLQADVANMLQNGTDSDIIMSHGISWELPALQGRIEPLDDLYAMECDGGTVEDRIVPELLNDCKLKFDGKYYKLPWTNGVGGLVYNKVLFDKNGWEVPETYEDLVALCKTIKEAKVVANPDAPRPIYVEPFAWSGETYYWDYLVFDWWAQLEGMEGIRRIKNLESAEVFNPQGSYKLPQAVKLWTDLKVNDYSIKNSSGRDYISAQNDFINGYAAMMPNAQWFESEMRENIDPEVCEMIMMPAPIVPDAKVDDAGNPIRMNYSAGNGDHIIIPASAPNKEEAKKFLAYMFKEENAKLFTGRTLGVMLGAKYESLDGVEDKYLTSFARSVFEINKNSVKFNFYSQNNMILNNKLSLEWADTGINEYAKLANGETADYTVAGIFESRYNNIKANFDTWKAESDQIYGQS